MEKCKHEVETVKILGRQECIECILVRLQGPLTELGILLNQAGQEESLKSIKQNFDLNNRDIILMGWAWEEWSKRNY